MPHNSVCDQGSHLTLKEKQQRADNCRINGFNHIPYHSEAADLIERWNGLLMTQVQYLLGVTTLKAGGSVLQDTVDPLNQRPSYGAVCLSPEHIHTGLGMKCEADSSLLSHQTPGMGTQGPVRR